MKKMLKLSFLAICILSLTNCNKEEIENVDREVDVTIKNSDDYEIDLMISGDEEGATIQTQALTNQIKASVEQLDMLISGFENINEHITESKDQILSIQIAITDLFISKFESNEIPDVIRPQNLNRFSESIIKLMHHSERVTSNDYRRIRKEILKLITEILDILKKKSYPLSITLYQSILGELIILEPNMFDNSKLNLFITDDVLTFYPQLRLLSNKFNIEEE